MKPLHHWYSSIDQSASNANCLVDCLTIQTSWLVSNLACVYILLRVTFAKKYFKTKYSIKSQIQSIKQKFCTATLRNIAVLLFLSKRKQREFKETFKLCFFKEDVEHFDRDHRRTTYLLHTGEFHPDKLCNRWYVEFQVLKVYIHKVSLW